MMSPFTCPVCGITSISWSGYLLEKKHQCVPLPSTRKCKRCGLVKEISEFYKQRIGVKKDGELFNYGHICTDCYELHNLIPNLISSQLKINVNTVRNHPELIKAWQIQLQVKRLLKQKKHENTKTI